ncbi:class I SAM-dependent methyltransferase [Rufibacter hautae]|nr:class I SAM-dependent methyltransferase [Rufibacter hautae]
METTEMSRRVAPYLQPGKAPALSGDYLEFPLNDPGEGLLANAFYFGHPGWAEEYLTYCHRSEAFTGRWKAAIGDWAGKVVVDIGCGPGNVYASLGGGPALLIGVDVAPASLRLAKGLGYATVLADASDLPFASGFADVVTLNATLHHCQDMGAILREAARLVKPGGLLVTDHDPQRSAWDYRGLAKLLWDARLVIYKLAKHSFHKSGDQQARALASELHHRPGHGVTEGFFQGILQPLGFEVRVYPHNHGLGAEVLQGQAGPAEFKYRLGNLLSYRNPDAKTSALTLMCVARKPSADGLRESPAAAKKAESAYPQR